MPWQKTQRTIVEEIKEHPVLLKACKQPQLMFVPAQNYGVTKLWERIELNKQRRK